MDNEFAEFEDMEVEDVSDQETLEQHTEAKKTTIDKSAATVISCLIYLFKLPVFLNEKFHYLCPSQKFFFCTFNKPNI